MSQTAAIHGQICFRGHLNSLEHSICIFLEVKCARKEIASHFYLAAICL